MQRVSLALLAANKSACAHIAAIRKIRECLDVIPPAPLPKCSKDSLCGKNSGNTTIADQRGLQSEDTSIDVLGLIEVLQRVPSMEAPFTFGVKTDSGMFLQEVVLRLPDGRGNLGPPVRVLQVCAIRNHDVLTLTCLMIPSGALQLTRCGLSNKEVQQHFNVKASYNPVSYLACTRPTCPLSFSAPYPPVSPNTLKHQL